MKCPLIPPNCTASIWSTCTTEYFIRLCLAACRSVSSTATCMYHSNSGKKTHKLEKIHEKQARLSIACTRTQRVISASVPRSLSFWVFVRLLLLLLLVDGIDWALWRTALIIAVCVRVNFLKFIHQVRIFARNSTTWNTIDSPVELLSQICQIRSRIQRKVRQIEPS